MTIDVNDDVIGDMLTQMKRVAHLRQWLTLLALTLLFTFPQRPEAGVRQGPIRVLLINSYHPGFPTFFQQVAGIRSVLDEKDVLLDVEFMDSKRFPGSDQRERFLEELSRKLPRIGPYDVVITADDNALIFALTHGDDLFGGVPIVFLGVNDRALALAQNDNPSVTGVVEAVSMEGTLALMAHLHPFATGIVAIVDDTPSGQGDLKTFYDKGDVAGLPLSHISLADLTFTAFTEKLGTVDSGKLVLLLSAYRDADGERLRFDESLSLIRKNMDLPLYHLWDHGLGNGIMGGQIISHFEQGTVAAEMVAAILDGKPVSEVLVVGDNPNLYTFDFEELFRFNIALADLPEGSIVINRPVSLFERHRELFVPLTTLISGLLLGILLLAGHVRTLQRTRRVVQESEEKYRNFFHNNAPTLVIDKTAGVIVDANPSACRYYGYDIEEIRGLKIATINTLPEMELQKAICQAELPYLFQHRLADGEIRDVAVYRSSIKTGGKKLIYSTIYDITDRLQAEKKLKKSEQEKSRLEGRLRHAEKMETIGTLAGGIAHDFNNILFPIIGFAEMGLDVSKERKSDRRYFEGILKAAFRARDLVQQILIFSRKGGEDKRPLRLQSVIVETLDLVWATLPSTIRITRKIEKSCGPVMAEPTRVHQIVMNLATNAAHAMEQSGGELTVSLSEVETEGGGGTRPSRFLKLSFEDTGTGMSELVQNRIFEPYFTTKEVGKGTGMGLSMVHGIVQGHNGHITVSSKLGEGTRFDLFFPLILTTVTFPEPPGLEALLGGTE